MRTLEAGVVHPFLGGVRVHPGGLADPVRGESRARGSCALRTQRPSRILPCSLALPDGPWEGGFHRKGSTNGPET